MTRPFDICIRGAGIVGRTLALHLAGKQLRVALVTAEADATNTRTGASDVRAYALNQASRQLLESVRCWPDEIDATPVLSMQVHGDDGGEVAFNAAESKTAALNWIVFHVEQGMGVPMGSIVCRFLSPSKVGEMLHLSLSINRIGKSSLELNVSGKAGGETRVQATLTLVLASLETRRSLPFPEDLRTKLEGYLLPESG